MKRSSRPKTAPAPAPAPAATPKRTKGKAPPLLSPVSDALDTPPRPSQTDGGRVSFVAAGFDTDAAAAADFGGPASSPTRAAKDPNRFGHLLKPIRDLAENWAVDVAQELEDYLHEIEHIQFSFGKGETFNFAEAALLIQGSACIYSKKVEYLYQLVYETLDLLASRRSARVPFCCCWCLRAGNNQAHNSTLVHQTRQKAETTALAAAAAAAARANGDDPETADLFQEHTEEFLPLDDLPEAKNLDLKFNPLDKVLSAAHGWGHVQTGGCSRTRLSVLTRIAGRGAHAHAAVVDTAHRRREGQTLAHQVGSRRAGRFFPDQGLGGC